MGGGWQAIMMNDVEENPLPTPPLYLFNVEDMLLGFQRMPSSLYVRIIREFVCAGPFDWKAYPTEWISPHVTMHANINLCHNQLGLLACLLDLKVTDYIEKIYSVDMSSGDRVRESSFQLGICLVQDSDE